MGPVEATKTWEEAVLWLRAQPERQELVRAAFYDDPLLEAAQRYRDSTEWSAVRALLPAAPGRALDVGAGRGIAAFALASDGWATTALEPDPSAIVGAGAIRSLADDAGVRIDVAQTWGEDLPFEDGAFDVVHCRQVLHHARDLAQFCRQVQRVLRPGGVFIGTREHVISRRDDLPQFLRSHPLHDLYGGENAYLLSEYKAAIQGAGLKLFAVLNPLQSDINLYPETKEDVRRRLARRARLPSPSLVPDFALTALGALKATPGRLYTFAARKVTRG